MTNQIPFTLHFPIQQGIPAPDVYTPPRRYPLREMQPGDSFFIPSTHLGGLYKCISHFRDRLYTSRVLTEDDVRGRRVWRLK